MKEKTLLRRFRWPIFILTWGAGQYCGTMFLYGYTKQAAIGFAVALGIGVVAVVLNGIDESPKTIAEKYEQNI
jgi:hypothetical protein